MQYCNSIPNAVTEYDEKKHIGSIRFLNNNGNLTGTVIFYIIDSGLAFDRYSFSSEEDVVITSDAEIFSHIPLERVKISYCNKGRCEATLTNNHQYYISGGEISINCEHPVILKASSFMFSLTQNG